MTIPETALPTTEYITTLVSRLRNTDLIDDFARLDAADLIERLRGVAATAVWDATEAMALAGARSIGNTIHTDNHMVRARECWRAMWDARDGIVEPIPQGTLVSRPMQALTEETDGSQS